LENTDEKGVIMSLFKNGIEKIGGNRVVMALSIARLGDAIGNSILIIVIPLFVAALPAPLIPLPESVRVGILISLYGLVNTILQPFTGALSDRLGRRKLLIQAGLLVMGLGTLGFLLAVRFTDLLILRSLQGIGVAITVPAALALMVAGSHKASRGGSMGIYTTFRMVGFATGPLIGGYLLDRMGFNVSFYAGALFILIGFAVVQVWVKDVPIARRAREQERFQVIDPKLLSAGILGVGFATFVMAGAFSMMSTLEDQFNTRLGITAFAFSIAFSALMISRLIFQVPIGRWSDRIGRKGLIVAGLVLMAPSTALLGYATSVTQLIILRLIQGLASAGIAAPAFAVAGDLAIAGGEGRQMSIITMGFGLGISLGPLIAGILAVGSFQLPFIVGGVLSLIGAWVIYRYVPETVHRNVMSEEKGESQDSASHVDE
jgi:MFS family permease